MPESSGSDEKAAPDRRGEAAVETGATRAEWTTRGAVLFWIGISGVVWVALALWLS